MLVEVIEETRKFAEKRGLFEKKILMLFSGGKDSSLALYILKEAGLNVSALTFFHRWSWRETINWAMKFTKKLGVEHYLVDVTEGLLREAAGRKGPICINCKKAMLWNAKWFALNNGFGVLAKGGQRERQDNRRSPRPVCWGYTALRYPKNRYPVLPPTDKVPC